MTSSPTTRARPHGTTPCTDADCGSGRRNNYFLNKRLTPDTFRVEQAYQIDRRRLINRAIHGWGVVFGFALSRDDDAVGCAGGDGAAPRLRIDAGLALDAHGRELLQEEPLLLDVAALAKPGPGNDAARRCWLLRVHYAEMPMAPLTLKDPCHCERHEWDQVCETVRYTITPIDCAACCAPPARELDCACRTSACCADDKPAPRGGCRCLCDHLTSLQPGAPCDRLTPACDGARVDLDNGVPLACLRLSTDECGRLRFESVHDDCGPRRLVKRNDLLFDLVQGLDLTRIAQVSWASWHRRDEAVRFKDFLAFFGSADADGGHVTQFSIDFTRPVRVSTLKPDCVEMTLAFRESEGGWHKPLRVPIVALRASASDGLASSATLVVRSAWFKDAIDGTATRFDSYGARVEIRIHGDYILDCNGQAVDANAVGLAAAPTGNGTPGGTYLSTFRVARRERGPRADD